MATVHVLYCIDEEDNPTIYKVYDDEIIAYSDLVMCDHLHGKYREYHIASVPFLSQGGNDD